MDQVEVVLPRPARGKAGRRRKADQSRNSGALHLVDELEAATAGHHGDAAGDFVPVALECADQLVQRIVPTDVFAAQQQLAPGIDE